MASSSSNSHHANAAIATATTDNKQLPPHSEDVNEELQLIRLALQAVFFSDSSSGNENWWQQRQLADAYLTSFQSTPVAWRVCDVLLREENASVKFFAAQTLHNKCRRHVHQQLPPESLPSLRDSLVQQLAQEVSNNSSNNANTALTTRLALSISALAVQMSWLTIVTDLLHNTDARVSLEILTVLPEECASDRLYLRDENVRYHMRDHLVETSLQVLQFCQSLLQQQQSQVNHQKSWKAVHAWIRHVPILPDTLCQTQLLEAAIQVIVTTNDTDGDESITEIAVDVVVEVLRMYPSHIPANQALVIRMISLLTQHLQPSFEQLFQQQHDVEKEDLLRGHCRIVTEMGESYTSLLLRNYQEAQSRTLVDWVLQCSSIHNTEISSMTLHFWYQFVTQLEDLEPLRHRQAVVDAFSPALLRLLDVCVLHLLKFPIDFQDDDTDQDLLDDLRRDRYYVAETVQDCCRLLGGHAVLAQVTRHLQQECNRVGSTLFNNAAANANNSNDWQGTEACLYAIQAIHDFIPHDEDQCLPHVMQLIPQLPPNVSPLRFTASMVVGKYASWLLAQQDAVILQPIMPFLAQGLAMPKCAAAAATAIKLLCENTLPQNSNIGDSVLQLYQQLMEARREGTVQLQVKDELEILEGVVKALSSQLQQQREQNGNTSQYLTCLVQPIGTRLTNILSTESNKRSNANVVHQIVHEVERLTVVVRYWKAGKEQVVDIARSVWSLLDAATRRHAHNPLLSEKTCRFHKHCLRNVGPQAYAPMLDMLLQQIVSSFALGRQSPYLYCASICVTDYGRLESYTPRLLETVSLLTQSAFEELQDFDKMVAQPDVVEELFYMMGRVISYCGQSFLSQANAAALLTSLFQCAVQGMRLDHRDANRGTLHFMETAICFGVDLSSSSSSSSSAASMASLEQALTQQGQAVVSSLVLALVGDLPAYFIVGDEYSKGSIAGILWKLNLLCGTLLQTWLTAAMAAANAPEKARSDFLASGFLNHSVLRQDFNAAVRAFVSASDRHRKLQQP